MAASFAILILALAMHAALLPQGQWYDEYFTFSFFRLYGWHGFLFRLLHWSPRPVSEILAFAYARAVDASGRPLIAPVLGLAWSVLFAFLAAALRPWRNPGRATRAAMVLALPALFLLAGPVGELWYWPLGALAYLPALAATSFATLLLSTQGNHTRGATLALAATLTMGALSAEIGAFFVLILCPLLIALAWRAPSGNRVLQAGATAIPFGAALAVMAGLVHGRAADTSIPVHAAAYHHAGRSLIAAWPSVAAGILGIGGSLAVTAQTIASRALLPARSWAALCRAWPAPVPKRPLLAILAALAGTALLSTAGAFYTMGALCCERHDAYRDALYSLMVVASAALLPRRAAWPGWAPRAAMVTPACLAAAVAIAAPARAIAIMAELRLAPSREAAKAETFHSGSRPGSETLNLVLPPRGPLLTPYHIEPGTYSMVPLPAWYVQGPMLFFHKTRMNVTSPQ
jgi:hypothetical protein